MYAMVYLPYIYHKHQPNVGNYTMHGWKEYGDVILFFFRPFQLSGRIFQRNVSMIPGSSNSVQLKSYVPRHPNTSWEGIWNPKKCLKHLLRRYDWMSIGYYFWLVFYNQQHPIFHRWTNQHPIFHRRPTSNIHLFFFGWSSWWWSGSWRFPQANQLEISYGKKWEKKGLLGGSSQVS